MATIKPKRGTTAPGVGTIIQNELAVDTTNKRIYIGAVDGSGTLIGSAPGGSTTQVQFNDGGNLGGDAGLTYDKTTDNLTIAGDLAVNGGDITTTSANGQLFSNAATIGIGTGATSSAITLGNNSASGSIKLLNSALVGTFTTSKLTSSYYFVPSTIDFGFNGTVGVTENMYYGCGAVTTLGDFNGDNNATTITIDDNLTSISCTGTTFSMAGDLAVNGGDITTSVTGTAALFNTNATTLNIGGAATAINIGATTGTSTFKNSIVAPAGTTSLAPFKMQSGTNLTTATAGSFEYDGKCFYETTANGRGLAPVEHFAIVTSTRTISNVNTAQAVFDSANDTILLASNTTYAFEGFYRIISGTTAHTTNMNFSEVSIGTLGTWYWLAINHTAAAGTVSRAQDSVVFSSAAGGATNASSGTALVTIWFRGTVETSTDAVSVTPQITFSAAPGGTNQIGAGSFIRFTPLGTDTVQSVGPWS